MFQRAVCTDWIQREIDLMERVHKLENCDLKVTCFLLESLVARIPGGAGKLFEIRPTWMTVMLHAMQEAGPSPAIGKCIVSVLKVRRKELVQQDAMVLFHFESVILRCSLRRKNGSGSGENRR